MIAFLIFTILYPGQRINLLYFFIVIFIILVQKCNLVNPIKLNKVIAYSLISLPILCVFVYFLLGFNILDFGSYIDNTSVKYGDEDLFDDTRTFIFEESIMSLKNHGTWFLGETPAFGYESIWRTSRFGTISTLYRLSEVAIVNIYVWFGVLGLISFVALFIDITKKAVLFNNINISFMGTWVAIYFFMCWIGNCNAWVSNDAIIIYIIMGFILRVKKENWTNKEIKLYIRQTLSTKILKQ